MEAGWSLIFTCSRSSVVSYPIFDHAQVEDSYERLVTGWWWTLQEEIQFIRVQQPACAEMAVQKEATDRFIILAIHCEDVVHESTLAAPVEHVVRELSGKRGPSHGAISASSYPHPAWYAEAGLHDGLREKGKTYAPATCSECAVSEQLITRELEYPFAVALKRIGRCGEPWVKSLRRDFIGA